MRRSLAFGIIGASLLFASTASAEMSDELSTLTVRNDTGTTINFLYISPGDSEHWGADILGASRTFDTGEEIEWFGHHPQQCNNFDFKAVDDNDKVYEIYNFEICDNAPAKLTINASNMSDSSPANEYVEVTFKNVTGETIYYLFMSPSDSEMWGMDQLDTSTTFDSGTNVSLLVPKGTSGGSFDVLGVTEDDTRYRFKIEVDFAKDKTEYEIEASDRQ